MLYWPTDLAFAPDGRAYILDWQNHRVRRVNLDDKFETVIGTGDVGDGPDTGNERMAPGVPGTDCILNHPTDVAFDPDGTVLRRRLAQPQDPPAGSRRPGWIASSAGAGPGFTGDGMPALGALLNQPKAVVVSHDHGRDLRRRHAQLPRAPHRHRRRDHHRGRRRDGRLRGRRRPAAAALLEFQMPNDNPEPGGGLAIDAQDRLYIVDTENQRIRRVDFAADVIETVAGNGTAGFSGDGGPATEASLAWPRDAAIGPDGRLYIADTDNHRIRAVDLATGIITTVAGDGVATFGGDGGLPAAASLKRPWGIAFDGAATSTSPTRSTTASGR